MSVALTIRRYRDEDHDAVWVLQHMAEGTLTADEVPPARADDPDYGDFHRIEAVYLRPRGEFLVGIHEGQIVAIGALQQTSPKRAEVKRMRVHRDHQPRRYGRAILAALETRAVELGYTTLHLDTTVDRMPARRWYLDASYREVGRSVDGLVYYEKQIEGGHPFTVVGPEETAVGDIDPALFPTGLERQMPLSEPRVHLASGGAAHEERRQSWYAAWLSQHMRNVAATGTRPFDIAPQVSCPLGQVLPLAPWTRCTSRCVM
jgi:GNAT superfamily N-acetyltransferase